MGDLRSDVMIPATNVDGYECDRCQHCGGPIADRNPTGNCDHLYWPDNLSITAKLANGFRPVQKTVWQK